MGSSKSFFLEIFIPIILLLAFNNDLSILDKDLNYCQFRGIVTNIYIHYMSTKLTYKS